MIRLANKMAAKSRFIRARMGAVITKGGRVLSTGTNKVGFSKKLKEKHEYSDTIHAEEAAIIPLLDGEKQHLLVGATIHVSRILKDGSPGMAKPCPTCQKLIEAAGIKKVFYTTESGVKKL